MPLTITLYIYLIEPTFTAAVMIIIIMAPPISWSSSRGLPRFSNSINRTRRNNTVNMNGPFIILLRIAFIVGVLQFGTMFIRTLKDIDFFLFCPTCCHPLILIKEGVKCICVLRHSFHGNQSGGVTVLYPRAILFLVVCFEVNQRSSFKGL